MTISVFIIPAFAFVFTSKPQMAENRTFYYTVAHPTKTNRKQRLQQNYSYVDFFYRDNEFILKSVLSTLICSTPSLCPVFCPF